jgi:hypothetical protein
VAWPNLTYLGHTRPDALDAGETNK